MKLAFKIFNKLRHKVFIFLLFVVFSTSFEECYADNNIMSSQQGDSTALFAEKSKNFALKLSQSLSAVKLNENIVFSPLSVQTCAAMARIGATGETASQLDRGLGLISSDNTRIAESFHQILSKYKDSPILKIANKIYVMQGYSVKPTFNEILSKYFLTTADEINFSHNAEAADTINDWVEKQTNNLIKKLVSPDVLNGATRLVLLNAIHFKGEWVHKFRKAQTHEHDFYLNEVDTVKVEMMSQKERFSYAELPELDATALELPYKDTDLTMLVILPNSRTGLQSLLTKMQEVSLADITAKLSKTQVIVKLPKFKAEFQVELTEHFKQLGMTRMFSSQAEFGEMLDTNEALTVSKIIHKAFIDVNEEGTEAAAATAMLMRKKRSLGYIEEPKEFIAEHPFMYFINRIEPVEGVDIDITSGNKTPVSVGSKSSVLPLFMGTIASLFNVSSLESIPTLHEEL